MCYLILPWLNDRSCCCVIRMSRVQVVESVSCKCFTDAELSTMNSQWFRSFCETRHGGSFVAPDVFPGQPYMDDSASAICEPQDEEANAMAEESPSGDNAHAANVEDSNMNMDCLVAVKVRTMHLSSRILASKSPFFYKLLYNSMRESKQRHVTLKIAASEEAPLMELLHFMCNNNSLNVTSPPALLDVLMVADKFDVASCVRYCSRVLRNIPMTCRKLKKVLTCNDFDHEVALMLVIRKLARFVRFPYVATASGTATTISRSLDAKMWMLRLQGTATGVGVKL